MKLLFVTHNAHKLKEIKALLPEHIQLSGLHDISFFEDIPEPYDTIEKNALHKARFIFNKFGVSCFADDTGLEVDALGGEPGVFSARYAGEPPSDKNNIKKALTGLQGKTNRNAQFRTVVALIENGKEFIFEGIVKGKITSKEYGSNGFGYDPIFIPDGYDKTFAEMNLKEKNRISHRSQAIKKLCNHLSKI